MVDLVDTELLINTFPSIYHMAELESWPGIQKHGLLSASALLDLFEVTGETRFAIESQRRSNDVRLSHPLHGDAIIRDNKPMSDGALSRCLNGMSPVEWYRTLNAKVFFWLTEARLATLLCARAYRDRRHCVLRVNTRELLANYQNNVWLSAINSGATIFNPVPRGTETFRRIKDYPFEERFEVTHSRTKSIAELAIDYSVPSILQYLEEVTVRDQSGTIAMVYRRA